MEDFDTIYREYGKTVYGFLLSLSHDRLLSEELTQETMLRAIMNIDSFRGECAIPVWLCQIAKNLYYENQKKRRRTVSLEAAEIPRESGKDIARELEGKETAGRILGHLHELQEPYKEVFTGRIGRCSAETHWSAFRKE